MRMTSRGCALVLALAVPSGQEPFAHVAKVLTGKKATKHLDLRYLPGSRAAASIPRVAVMAERDLADMCKKLRFQPKARFTLWLYDDARELAAITRTGGTAGFSSGTHSHIPYDSDQTRYHEMVHLVAHQLPVMGKEPRSLFFAEGLANALLEFVTGVHVHAVAAFYLSEKKLPKLAEMTGPDFYGWMRKRPGFNAYDVAASWIRFLIDEHGIDKVKRYYRGVPARKAFGKSLGSLEKRWRTFLADYELMPAVRTLLAKRTGKPAKFATHLRDPDARLPKELLGKPEDWKSLVAAKLGADKPAQWKATRSGIHGKSLTNDWEVCRLGSKKLGDCALRARVRVPAKTVGVQVRLSSRCQLMVTNAGTFLYDKGVREMDRSETVTGRGTVDLLLYRRGKRVVGYIDGLKVIETETSAGKAVPAIGVAGGSAMFEHVSVRRF